MSNISTLNISTGTIVRIMLFGLLLVVLYLVRDVIAIILLSLVIASAVDAPARWFSERKIPRTIGVLIIYLISFLVLSAAFYVIIPTLLSEFSNFAHETPYFLEGKFILDFLNSDKIPSSLSSALKETFVKARELIISNIGGITSDFFQASAAIFGGAFSFVLIIVISFYLSVQEHGIENFIRIITPSEHEKYVIGLWARSQKKIGRWFQGQILLGIIIGTLVFIGLTILEVKYALTFAILSAIFELIPVFGPILAAVPAILVAFLQKPALAVLVAALYVIIQQFENHLIYPVVVKKTIGIPPILVILSLIIGGELGGFFGILLSMPVAVVLMEIMNDLALKKKSFA